MICFMSSRVKPDLMPTSDLNSSFRSDCVTRGYLGHYCAVLHVEVGSVGEEVIAEQLKYLAVLVEALVVPEELHELDELLLLQLGVSLAGHQPCVQRVHQTVQQHRVVYRQLSYA